METIQSELAPADQVASDGSSRKRIFPPPSECTPEWFRRFIEVAREHKIDQVTTLFLSSNKITAKKHEYKLMGALKFLNIVDARGNPTDGLNSLLVVGDAYKQNLRIVVESAYSDLLKVVSLKTTTPDGLYNYFISKMKLSKSQAEGASRFLIWLASESGLEVSEELLGLSDSAGEIRLRSPLSSSKGTAKPLIQNPTTSLRRDLKQGIAQNVQTNINIVLDKDTPIDLWKLVFRLLGMDSEAQDDKHD